MDSIALMPTGNEEALLLFKLAGSFGFRGIPRDSLVSLSGFIEWLRIRVPREHKFFLTKKTEGFASSLCHVCDFLGKDTVEIEFVSLFDAREETQETALRLLLSWLRQNMPDRKVICLVRDSDKIMAGLLMRYSFVASGRVEEAALYEIQDKRITSLNIAFAHCGQNAMMLRWAFDYLSSALVKEGANADVVNLGTVPGRSRCDSADVVVFYRTLDEESLGEIRRLRTNGKYLIYFIDDYIFQPNCKYTPNYDLHVRPFFPIIDAVVSSNQKLLDKTPSNKPKILRRSVIDRETFDILNPVRVLKGKNREYVVGWLAGVGRKEMNLFVRDIISRIDESLKEGERAKFVCFGNHGLTGFKKVTIVEHPYFKPEDWRNLYRAYRSFGFDVIINPLDENDEFCHCKCVDSKSRVMTNVGILEAGGLKKGMRVWRDGWKRIEGVEIEDSKDGLEIKTKLGYVLRLSAEHRMLIDGKWKRAGDFAIGDMMDMCQEKFMTSEIVRAPWPSDSRMNKTGRKAAGGMRGYAPSDPYSFLTSSDCPKIDITPRWGRILGAYVGDGSVGQGTTMRISCDGQDKDWIDVLMNDLKEIGLNARTETKTAYDGTVLRRREVRVSSSHLIRFLESLGLARSRENGTPIRVVCVPNVIWRSPKKVISEFLSGYFEADGCAGRHNISASSKNETFMRDIQRLLIAFGIVSRLSPVSGVCQTSRGIYWTLNLNKEASRVFEKEIGFQSGRKKHRLSEFTSRENNHSVKSMTWKDEIVSIKPCVITPVDIQVEGSEFVLAGFVSHNSELKYVETGAMMVPIVTSRVYPFTEVIQDGRNGFLASSPEEFADKALAVCRDLELAGKVAVTANEHVKNDYDSIRNARRFALDVFNIRHGNKAKEEFVVKKKEAGLLEGKLKRLEVFDSVVVGPIGSGEFFETTIPLMPCCRILGFSVFGATYCKKVRKGISYKLWLNGIRVREGAIPASFMQDNQWWTAHFEELEIKTGDTMCLHFVNMDVTASIGFYSCKDKLIGKSRVGVVISSPIAIRMEVVE